MNKVIKSLGFVLISFWAIAQSKPSSTLDNKLNNIKTHIEEIQQVHGVIMSTQNATRQNAINNLDFKKITGHVRLIHKLILWSKMGSLKKYRSTAYMQKLNHDRRTIKKHLTTLKKLSRKKEYETSLSLRTQIKNLKDSLQAWERKLISLRETISKEPFFIKENKSYKRRVFTFTLLRPSLLGLAWLSFGGLTLTVLASKRIQSAWVDVLLLTFTGTTIASFVSCFVPWEIIKK